MPMHPALIEITATQPARIMQSHRTNLFSGLFFLKRGNATVSIA